MTIVWNKVTWYSKLLAAIFFIFVVPAVTFHIGKTYEATRIEIASYSNPTSVTETDSINAMPQNMDLSTTASSVNSGIYGVALIGETPYAGHLAIKDMKGNVVTTTKTRTDGRFFLLLQPGNYEISAISSKPMPSIDPTDVAVQKGTIARITMQFK